MKFRIHRTIIRRSKIEKGEFDRKTIPDIVKEVIAMSDIVLEVIDARFPEETRNIQYEELVKQSNKKLIFVVNKSDLAEAKELEEKLDLLEIRPRVVVSCAKRKSIHKVRDIIKIEAKRMKKDKVYIGVIGYPNTGKSSVINLLAGKPATKISSEAGFTKGMQKIRLSEGLYLIDTPGVIPEKEDAIRKSYLMKHAKINVKTYTKIKDPEMVVAELMKNYPNVFEKFYKIDAKGDSELLIEQLGKRRNFLIKGGGIDADKTARIIIKDWQAGKIKI
ncbi:50S ribosome-binding GTPase [Candidatus Pacearchaeota archaeon]|nr:50S ribosome-binding GTPase [Candidatus Pacearchaeota archaeon]